ncbi:MAG: Rpn family recombination-promoting nuclease/putative transposase [Saprospiraceae bacterium]
MSSIIENDKYINPLTDFGFKKLFGTEMNKDLLIDFLNQILPKNKKVRDLAYASTDKSGATKKDRKAIFDLYCTSPEGDRFIVEMQKAKQTYFKDRSVFYSTFPIQEQAKKGDWNFKLSPVYSIGVLDFEFDDKPSKEEDISLHHIIELKNQEGEVFYDKLKFIYLELPKFTKEVEQLKTRYEKWLYVLRHLSNLQERPKALQERVFTKLFQAAEIANFSKEEKDAYEESLKHYRDIKNIVDSSIEEGRIEGKMEGRIEESDENVKKGIIKGYSNEIISDITGRSIKDIQRIRAKMKPNS